jgi:hypothetical protein
MWIQLTCITRSSLAGSFRGPNRDVGSDTVIKYRFSQTHLPRTHRAHDARHVELQCMCLYTFRCILRQKQILISLQLYLSGYLHPLSVYAQAIKRSVTSEDRAAFRYQRYQLTLQCDSQRCSRPKTAAAGCKSVPAKFSLLNHYVIWMSNRRCSISSWERS